MDCGGWENSRVSSTLSLANAGKPRPSTGTRRRQQRQRLAQARHAGFSTPSVSASNSRAASARPASICGIEHAFLLLCSSATRSW
jgi:hypothetical protein